jgi:hypothetical protein
MGRNGPEGAGADIGAGAMVTLIVIGGLSNVRD